MMNTIRCYCIEDRKDALKDPEKSKGKKATAPNGASADQSVPCETADRSGREETRQHGNFHGVSDGGSWAETPGAAGKDLEPQQG
jgi:hypothetical protein